MLSLAVWAQDMFSISVTTWDWEWDPFSHCVPLSDCFIELDCIFMLCAAASTHKPHRRSWQISMTLGLDRLEVTQVCETFWLNQWMPFVLTLKKWPKTCGQHWPLNHSLHCNKFHRSMKSSILLAKTVTSITESMNECDSWGLWNHNILRTLLL